MPNQKRVAAMKRLTLVFRSTFIALALACGAFSALTLQSGITRHSHDQSILSNGTSTDGTIIAVERHRSGNSRGRTSSDFFTATYSYSAQGTSFSNNERILSVEYSVGDDISVIYDPANPEFSRMNDSRLRDRIMNDLEHARSVALISGVLALGILIVGIIGPIILFRKNS